MRHPAPAELLDLHFGEAGPLRGARLSAHVRSCAACTRLVADVAWAERLLAAVPDAAPPADGLQRVLARVAPRGPVRPPAPAWRAAVPSLAALAAGAVCVAIGGAPAALAFFAAGSLVTLSLAPALILDSQRRIAPPAR